MTAAAAGPSLPPEFRLAVACCRWPPSPERDLSVRRRSRDIDWPRLAAIARRHRVEGLVWAGLRQAQQAPHGSPLGIPGPVAAGLVAAAREVALRNLRAAAESHRLRGVFAAAGLPILFVKGQALGVLAYGDPSVKASWDIDILVEGGSVESAAALLERDGYRLVIPKPERRSRLPAWHAHAKESVWHDPARDSWVELHTRLVDNVRLLRGVGWPAAPREVEVARGVSLPTLHSDELFAYLCVHGASSAWFRLKWIADLAALLSGCQAAEIDRLYDRSQALGAGRAAAQALLLCRTLFGTPLSDDLGRKLARPVANRLLSGLALRQMAGRSVATEVTRQRLGTLYIHLTQFGLLPGWGFKLSELKRQAMEPLRRLR